MTAARAAIDKAGGDVVFTARAEGFLRGRPDLDETIRRLKAFAAAGADCLYAPGIRTREQIEATVRGGGAQAGQLPQRGSFGFTRRAISPPSACAASASAARSRAWRCTPSSSRRREIANEGKFDGFAGLISNPELNKFFSDDRKKRVVMTDKSDRHPFTGQPIGPPVDATPARRPEPVVLEGRYGRVERLRPDHDADLWNVVKGHDPIWTYMSAYGPFANFSAFSEWLAGR